jgi:hypothetical protein
MDFYASQKNIEKIFGHNYIYLNQIDRNNEGAFTVVTISSDVYKIKNTDKINCNTLKQLNKNNTINNDFYFNNFEKEYINLNKEYCSTSFIDHLNRSVEIIIQDNILIIKIYVN